MRKYLIKDDAETVTNGRLYVIYSIISTRNRKKPNTFHVLFDHAAMFQGRCSNNCLLQELDATTSLMGASPQFWKNHHALGKFLCRFECPWEWRILIEVPVMGERSAKYRTTSHSFGLISPSFFANFALGRMAIDWSMGKMLTELCEIAMCGFQ